MEVQSLFRKIAYKSCSITIKDELMSLTLEGINIDVINDEELLLGGNNVLSLNWNEAKITKEEGTEGTIYHVDFPGKQVYIEVPKI